MLNLEELNYKTRFIKNVATRPTNHLLNIGNHKLQEETDRKIPHLLDHSNRKDPILKSCYRTPNLQ